MVIFIIRGVFNLIKYLLTVNLFNKPRQNLNLIQDMLILSIDERRNKHLCYQLSSNALDRFICLERCWNYYKIYWHLWVHKFWGKCENFFRNVRKTSSYSNAESSKTLEFLLRYFINFLFLFLVFFTFYISGYAIFSCRSFLVMVNLILWVFLN